MFRSSVYLCVSVKLILKISMSPTFPLAILQDLNELATMVRKELPQLIRDVIINLVTIDVHARDIVTTLVENRVMSR